MSLFESIALRLGLGLTTAAMVARVAEVELFLLDEPNLMTSVRAAFGPIRGTGIGNLMGMRTVLLRTGRHRDQKPRSWDERPDAEVEDAEGILKAVVAVD
jgi:hypothetical protein